jgi:hypothetical protein
MAERTIAPKPVYDKESDVLYVRFFDDNEPTFVENVDDILLLEIGWFSGLPKGFRILGPKYHNIGSINVTVMAKQIKKQIRQLMEEKRKAIKEQEPIFTHIFDKLPSIFASVR